MVGADAEPVCRAIELERAALVRRPFSFTYLIWKDPWMAVGRDTFISALLAEAGGTNEATGADRFPVVTFEELRTRSGLLVLSSEPFPFAERHVAALVEAGISRERIHLVDGELLSWHGSRLRQGLPYLRGLVAGFLDGG